MKKTLLPVLLIAFAFSTQARAIEVAFEQDNNLPLVYLNVAVKGGAVTDPDHQSGLTNFMGEMLLRGTRSRSKEQIDLALDQMGATLAVEVRSEALIMRGAVLSSQLAPFKKLVRELITEPMFPANEIRKLKSEIVSGILQEFGNDSSLSSRRFATFLFRGHPYGKPILGKIKDVEGLTSEQITAHYERLFRDGNILIVGTGDAKTQDIEAWGDAIARSRPGTEPGGEITKVAQPENAPTRRLQIIDKPDRTQTQINAGQIGLRMTDKDFFPLWLGNHAFGGGSFSARMMVEIRVKRGWSYGANSYFRQGLQPRSWQFHLFPKEADTAPALAYSLQMVQDLKDKGITPEEFNFSKQSLVNGAGFMFNTPQKRVENKLLERTLDLPDGFMKSYGPELQKVTIEQVNDSLKEFLKTDHLAISVLGTAQNLREPLAKAAGVPLDQVEVVPYTQE